MYNVYLDGQVLYSTAQTDTENIILNPRLIMEVNKSGSFSFTLPPCHALYDSITKLKSVVTVEQDGAEIFRGRVLNDETDFFGQRNVSCEGELSYFLDSLQPPCEFDGTAMGLLQQIMSNHNSAVEEAKQFTLGTVTAFSEDQTAQVETGYYSDTMSELNTRMLGAYGGYFRIRHADGVRYLDYLSETDTNTQPIEFGVNLLDLTKHISANEVFTVLYPFGAAQQDKEGESLDITSVNNGVVYIEDAAAVAKYGRISRTKTWSYVDDPAVLLTKAREYLATGISEETTLVIKAVDMHFVDEAQQRIGIGDMVHIVSNPHGIDRTIICYKMEVDILNPEFTQYTFGKPVETLTDNAVLAKQKLGGGGGGGGKTIDEEIKEWNTWADIFEKDTEATLQLTTGAINLMNGQSSGADIDLNGVTPLVKLSAHTQDIDTLTGRVSKAESSILVNAEGIKMKVDKDGVIGAINLTEESAVIDASKIDLNGYVTMDNFESVQGWANNFAGDIISGNSVTAGEGEYDELSFGDAIGSRLTVQETLTVDDNEYEPKTTTVLTGIGTVSVSRNVMSVMKADGTTGTIDYVTKVEITPNSTTLRYLGRKS